MTAPAEWPDTIWPRPNGGGMFYSWCPCGRAETGWDEKDMTESLRLHIAGCPHQNLRTLVEALAEQGNTAGAEAAGRYLAARFTAPVEVKPPVEYVLDDGTVVEG